MLRKSRFRKTLALLPALLFLLASIEARAAASPADQYVRIYNLIQEVDILQRTGATAKALAKCQEAHAALLAFQGEYPAWNPRIVSFRLDYLTTRIQALGGEPATVPTNAALTAQRQPAHPEQTAEFSSTAARDKALPQTVPPANQGAANVHGFKVAPVSAGDQTSAPDANAKVKMPETPKELADYKIGDIAQEDVVTSFRLIAVDPDGTAALREKEAQRIPAIFRFNPGVIDEVEASLRSEFASMRVRFLDEMEGVFQKRRLGAQALTSPRFKKLRASFKQQNRLAALNTNVFACWARGESDEPIQAEFVARLRAAMEHYLRPFSLPADIKLGQQVRILPAANASETLTAEQAEKVGVLAQRKDVYVLSRVKEELAASFPTNKLAAAKLLASFLRTNCVLDADLTRQSRVKRTGFLWAGDRFEPGATIVKRGQVIDARIEMAINQLKEKLIVRDLRDQVADGQLRNEAARRNNRWLLAGGLSLSAMLGLALWRLARRRRSRSLLPVRIGSRNAVGTVISCPACAENIFVPSAQETLRGALLPHLARLMGKKLIQRLLSQRAELVDTQQKAVLELTELEERLEKIHAPLQDRLKAYERRILELERELATKGEENRALTEAKISLVRRQLKTVAERN